MELVNKINGAVIDAKLKICCKVCKNYVEVEPVIENDYDGCYYPDDRPELLVKATCTLCGTEYETNIY